MAFDELGTDFSLGPDENGVLDITDDLATVDGGTAYVQCIVRALLTEGIFYDPRWGRDMTRIIGETGLPMSVIAQMVEAVCADDERTRTARFEPSVQEDETIGGPLFLETDEGPHEFTLSIDAAASKVLAVTPVTSIPTRLLKGSR